MASHGGQLFPTHRQPAAGGYRSLPHNCYNERYSQFIRQSCKPALKSAQLADCPLQGDSCLGNDDEAQAACSIR